MAAQSQGSPLTRREMLGRLFRPFQKAVTPAGAENARSENPATSAPDQIAVIAGRHCLAYQGTGCAVCHERCPVSGALILEQGLPRVVAEICTGCRICHEVCPAPENAIRIVPRPPGLAKPVASDMKATVKSPFPHLPGVEGSRV
ncbi:MAG: hypothetical protein IPP19_16740 [Verrucomicrobia bacterium]|nr:hypothetical protein [Verrucomicrobiota bacterium]